MIKNLPPIQYQQGWIEFYKLKFKVTPDVLIPRPETELLVDYILDYLKPLTKNHQLPSIFDIGTGAGNIAVSIAKNSPEVQIIASDISQKALKIAQQNAKLHGVSQRIKFLKSDLLTNFNCTLDAKRSDLILVTNLPYIPKARIPYLDPSVKDFEPHIALNGGKDGFELYRKLFKQLQNFNYAPGRCTLKLLVGEIDYTHGELAVLEAQKYFPNHKVEVKLDLAHRQRILIIKDLTLGF